MFAVWVVMGNDWNEGGVFVGDSEIASGVVSFYDIELKESADEVLGGELGGDEVAE